MVVRPADGTVLAVAGGLERLREAAPPGSVVKIVTAYAALAGGLTDSGRRIRCTGVFEGRTCAKAHGPLNVEQALAQSCNVHFLTLGAEVGAARLRAAARQFGFGSRTGADSAEAEGSVGGEVPDLAYGVGGFAATPLQLVRAMAAVANGGRVLRLRLGDGPAQVVGALDDRHLAPIRAGLRAGTRAGGTAEALAGVDVAGKTGTAVFDGGTAGAAPRWYGHFAGFAPAARPVVVAVVRVEGRSAAHDAVPVARVVLGEIGRHQVAVGGTPALPGASGRASFELRPVKHPVQTAPGTPALPGASGRASSELRPVKHSVQTAPSDSAGTDPGAWERRRPAGPLGLASPVALASGAWERRRLAGPIGRGQKAIRVLLWAAADVASFEVSAPGGRIEAGGERSGIDGKRLQIKAVGGHVVAESSGRQIRAERMVIRPAPGATIALRPLAASRRGRAESYTVRRIPGPIVLHAERGGGLGADRSGSDHVARSGSDQAARSGRLSAIAELAPDDYSAAVAAAELGPGWPAAAVAAQAVLARTYAARHPDRHAADGADLCDITHCQVYKGAIPAGASVRRALAATAGTVLTSGGEPIEALYHSICGGRRLANEDVFGGKPLPYLRGGPDPWCARSPRYAAWRARFSRDQLTRAFGRDSGLNLGTITGLTVSARVPAGVPAAITLDGSRGTRTLPAYQVWRDLGMALGWNHVKSVRFTAVPDGDGVVFLGRGLGHSVGMCQWGARAQAENGATAARILAGYYPGTRLEAM